MATYARRIALVAIVFALIGGLYYQQTQTAPLKVSGYIEAHQIRIGSRVGGRVAETLVAEGDEVKPGQVLVRLEPFDLLEQLAEAQSDMEFAKHSLQMMQAGFRKEEIAQAKAERDRAQAAFEELKAGPRKQEIEEARASVELAAAESALAKIEFNRAESLRAKQAASPEEYDSASTKFRVAQSTLAAKKARLALLEEGTRIEQIAQAQSALAGAEAELARRVAGFRAEEISEAEARHAAAQARVASIRQRVAELEIRAPAIGSQRTIVEAIDLRPGDLISPNAPVLSLTDPGELWVRAYLPENRLGLAHVGGALSIGVDSFPDRRFRGKVVFVAREGEFTPSNVQTTEERGKQVYRIKVVLEDGLDVLRPGMAADVYLEETAPR